MPALSFHRGRTAVALLATYTFLSACDGVTDRQVGAPGIDAELRALIAAHDLQGDPSLGRVIPGIEDPVAQLGMALFFTKGLGGDMDSACVTCHHPTLGGGDDLALPIGVGALDVDLLGPGRRHPSNAPTVPRNAPTTFNIVLWDQYLFHDGRVESLGKEAGQGGRASAIRTPDSAFDMADAQAGVDLSAAQARFPVTSVEEMRGEHFEAGNGNGAVRAHLAQRLGNYGAASDELPGNGWLQRFQTAFNSSADAESLVRYDNVAEALAAYQRSQLFVDTPWKAYVQGDASALSPAQKRGALVFFNGVEAGGANCASCHSGDFFTDEDFHNLAMPQIGPGKGDGPTGDNDFGRFRESGEEAMRFAFRTPSLLNVEVTGPYGHAGAYATLREAVVHHLDPEAAIAAFDWDLANVPQIAGQGRILYPNAQANTQAALDQLRADRSAGLNRIAPVTLSEQAIDDVVAFLTALTDPCVEDRACLSQWIPAEDDVDPDGLRLFAVDANGDPL
ncbi:cytochrome-c peroxidase [Algiphilus sp.]|uniref:cytochrome-c peroxidase n=1 Tax=Algiphilus sp. TaxID=1872431 RepID=UPI003B51F8DA